MKIDDPEVLDNWEYSPHEIVSTVQHQRIIGFTVSPQNHILYFLLYLINIHQAAAVCHWSILAYSFDISVFT